jgi:ketosteroid isomerase-like protein
MKTRIFGLLSIVCLLLAIAPPVGAQKDDDKKSQEKKDQKSPEKKESDKLHDELRDLKKGLTEAVLKKDVEKQLTFVTKDVVVTWQNGDVVKGHDGLKKFLDKGAESKMFQGYSKEPEPTDLTILYGDDTGISYGTSVGKYTVLGQNIELKNYWTATLVKEEGNWKISSYHVSGNLLDNPLLNAAKQYLYWVGGGALVVGLLLGFLVGRMTAKPGA